MPYDPATVVAKSMSVTDLDELDLSNVTFGVPSTAVSKNIWPKKNSLRGHTHALRVVPVIVRPLTTRHREERALFLPERFPTANRFFVRSQTWLSFNGGAYSKDLTIIVV